MDLITVKNNSYNGDHILGMLRGEARVDALQTISDIYLKRSATALADRLQAELLPGVEAAAEPLTARVGAAEQALATAEMERAKRMTAFWSKHKPGDPNPDAGDPAVEVARLEVQNAKHNAKEPGDSLRLLRKLIGDLRDCPGPDPEALAILHDALGCVCNGGSDGSH